MKKEKRLPRKIYVFGNTLIKNDSLAVTITKKLQKDFPKINFVHLDPNEEIKEKNITILDVAEGITKTTVLHDVNQLEHGKKFSLHDFDVAFSLKLMKKADLIKKIKIIAVPMQYSQKKAY